MAGFALQRRGQAGLLTRAAESCGKIDLIGALVFIQHNGGQRRAEGTGIAHRAGGYGRAVTQRNGRRAARQGGCALRRESGGNIKHAPAIDRVGASGARFMGRAQQQIDHLLCGQVREGLPQKGGGSGDLWSGKAGAR